MTEEMERFAKTLREIIAKTNDEVMAWAKDNTGAYSQEAYVTLVHVTSYIRILSENVITTLVALDAEDGDDTA